MLVTKQGLSLISCHKADQTIRTDLPQKRAALLQVVEVSNCLPHGEHDLMGIERAWKQGRQQFGRGARCAAGSQQHFAALAMMLDELIHS